MLAAKFPEIRARNLSSWSSVVEGVVPAVSDLRPPADQPALRPPFVLDPPLDLPLVGPTHEADVRLEVG